MEHIVTDSDANEETEPPESHAAVLLAVLEANVEWILERLLRYSTELDFASGSFTLIEAWRISVIGLTDSLRAAAELCDGIPKLSTDESYVGDDPIAQFALKEARLHRGRGVSLAMFLGFYHYFKVSYIELFEEKIAEPEVRRWCQSFIDRTFMRLQIAISVTWSELGDVEQVDELQSRNRELANEKNSLLTIVESVGKPIILVREDGTIGYMNHEAGRLLGERWGPGELYFQRQARDEDIELPESERITEFLVTPAREILPWLPDRAGTSETDKVWLKADAPATNHGTVSISVAGEPRQFEVFETPMYCISGWSRGRLLVLTDVTRIQSLITELRAGEARLRALLDTVDPTFLFADGRLVECNARARSLLGLPAGRAPGADDPGTDDPGTDERGTDNREQTADEARLPPELGRWAGMTLPEGRASFEDLLTVPGGPRRAVSVNVAEVTVADRREVLVTLHDIERLRHAQRVLESHHQELEKTIELRTSELRESLSQLRMLNLSLRNANEHKAKFLSFMSHELRTPLNSVLGFSELLASRHFGPLNAKQEQYVELIQSNGQHLLELVNDLIDLSRIDAGGARLVLGEHEPDELVRTVVRMLSAIASEKSMALSCVAMEPRASVLGDERAIRQILLNLVSNAIKFTDPHGSVNIRTFGVPERSVVRFEVVDTGVGIPEDEMPGLFSEFHQVSTRPPNAKGTGIGLALAKRLVEQLGGTIGVKSRIGVGSTFWFELPMVEARQEEAALLVTEAAPPQAGSVTVLVAEDDHSNQRWIRDVLSTRNHKVVVAENGRDAVALACSVHPDVILMDIRMPILDGLEATRLIRAEAETARLPIIGLTAHAGNESRDEALQAGMNEVLTKPCRAEAILSAVARWSGQGADQAGDDSGPDSARASADDAEPDRDERHEEDS